MSPAQSRKSCEKQAESLEPLYLRKQDESSESFNGYDSDASQDKDETERRLEKLVFGDELGFYDGLESYKDTAHSRLGHAAEDQGEDYEDEGREEGLKDVDDADLFFLGTNPSANSKKAVINTTAWDGGNSQTGVEEKAVWVDSDDERLVVSLASNPRLRKLRVAETEDVINGKEYTKRLRRQFERLHPVPDWANPSAAVRSASKKRRRQSNGDASSEDASADDMSIDSDNLSVQPLAKLLKSSTEFLRAPASSSTRRKLRPEVIDIQRTKDVGLAQPSSITSLTFHPLHPLLLSSGPASTLFLHHISPHTPNPNPLLTSLHLRSTPLTTSTFLPPNGFKIFFSSRRRYFHTWDLSTGNVSKISTVAGHSEEQRSMEFFKLSPCGRWMGLKGSGRKGGGVINVLDTETCQWVSEVRVEGKGGVADFDWWGDGNGMVVLGKGGEAVEWDGRQRRVVARWVDEGAVGTTVVALGGKGGGEKRLGGDRWIAVGSSSGIVNVYDRKTWASAAGGVTVVDADVEIHQRPKPSRALDHLTTPISSLVFSPDGQILAMSSQWKRDALRLVHLPTISVFRNWPTAATPLGRITAISFSPTTAASSQGTDDNNLDMLAVANEQGKIRLWEIRR